MESGRTRAGGTGRQAKPEASRAAETGGRADHTVHHQQPEPHEAVVANREPKSWGGHVAGTVQSGQRGGAPWRLRACAAAAGTGLAPVVCRAGGPRGGGPSAAKPSAALLFTGRAAACRADHCWLLIHPDSLAVRPFDPVVVVVVSGPVSRVSRTRSPSPAGLVNNQSNPYALALSQITVSCNGSPQLFITLPQPKKQKKQKLNKLGS